MEERQGALIVLSIIDSQKLEPVPLNQLQNFSEHLTQLKLVNQVEIYRTNSIKTLLNLVKDGCTVLVTQYCYFKMNSIIVKQALGIGEIQSETNLLAESLDAIFKNATSELKRLQVTSELASIAFEEKAKNSEWLIHSAVLSDLMSNWSRAQAEAIYYTLIGETQMEIAHRLKISQAAIHQRLKSAKLYLLQLFIKRFQACA